MTVEDFYGANIVENLAAFLNIPLTKVRVVNVISENGGSGRRKRNTDGTTVEVEIGDEPASGKQKNRCNEPRCEKTGLRGFRPGRTQTRLYIYRRWLEA